MARAGEIPEPILQRYHTIFTSKGIETLNGLQKGETKAEYRARLKQLKAKARTVVGQEVELLSGKKSEAKWDGEVFVSRTPTPMTQKINLITAVGKHKECLQCDEVGMFPWTANRGPPTIGQPPVDYWPEETKEEWRKKGYEVKDLAVPCTQANYGKKRAGFDAGDESHEHKLMEGWISPVQGLYVRKTLQDEIDAGMKEWNHRKKEGADARGPAWGPDSMCTYVDDDMMGVTSTLAIDKLEKRRGVRRTRHDVRKEPSSLLGVDTSIFTWSEKELGVVNCIEGETISIVVMSQRGLLETWVGVWKEKGRELLRSAPTPLPPGAVVDVDKQRPLGRYADEARHHVGVIRYAITWTRGVDLAYVGMLLAAYNAHWCAKADAYLTRLVSYVAETLGMCEFHVVSSREMKEGLFVQANSDASHAGHKDSRGHSYHEIKFYKQVTSFTVHSSSKKHTTVEMSTADEEGKGAVRATLKLIPAADAYEAVTSSLEKTKSARGESAEKSKLLHESLGLDATATIARIQSGADDLSRHSAMRVRWLHEYWMQDGRELRHERGEHFLPDIGTKALSIARFQQLMRLAPCRIEPEK